MPETERPKKYRSPELLKLALLALRVAATMDGAPKRCRRMKCRAGGRCTADTSCGGGLDMQVARNAASMIIFAAELVNNTCGVEAANKFAPPAPVAHPRGRPRGRRLAPVPREG
jgi:hypothetical protein